MDLAAVALAVVLGQAAPSPQPSPPAGEVGVGAGSTSIPTPSLRPLRLAPLPDGTFRATLGGQPVEGAAFYRAALRPDLAEQAEARERGRTTALVAAAGAAVAGPVLGWVAFRAQGRSEQECLVPPSGQAACAAVNAQIRRDNRALGLRGLAIGGAAGAAAAGLALWWRAAHPPLAPTLGEAEALVRAYEARRAAGATGLRWHLEPVPGGLLASAEWRLP